MLERCTSMESLSLTYGIRTSLENVDGDGSNNLQTKSSMTGGLGSAFRFLYWFPNGVGLKYFYRKISRSKLYALLVVVVSWLFVCCTTTNPAARAVTVVSAFQCNYNNQYKAQYRNRLVVVHDVSKPSTTHEHDSYENTMADFSNDNQAQAQAQAQAERKRIIQQILDEEDVRLQQLIIDKREKDEKQQLQNLKVMSQIAKSVGVTMTTLQRTSSSPADGTAVVIQHPIPAISSAKALQPLQQPTSAAKHTLTNETKGVKFHAKEQGTLVGSAGGWSLEIFPGDYVVHRKYGIGRFERTMLVDVQVQLGSPQYVAQQERRKKIMSAAKRAGWEISKIKKLAASFGTDADPDLISTPRMTVMEISYHDGLVHVPIEKAYRLSRFRSADVSIPPKLSKIRGGDSTWRWERQRVAQMTMEMAQDVLALYATREASLRPPFDPRVEHLVKQFCDTFPYQPTPDQLTCFETVENDMVWSRRPMDRLICGDVGFGKTEVAMRALFRCVANGRQAVLLAPTGVLAAQHYKTVLSRMGPDTPFHVQVGFLRGGIGAKAAKEVRAKIESGEVQVIVGTHALLSNTVPYKNIGLLVIDEEQRFGVKQKDRLKVISTGVDVLTLSATPIPRTLQMSLSGIRDTSTIRSPPPSRKSIVSVVDSFSETFVYEAISRELERKGQCYYVVPRISMIKPAMAMIQGLFPNIRITVAHGRMPIGTAEQNVEAFAEGKFDLLLATTVIENGVDIPTVNTIIIQDSQKFGMSTLYQLRGRVGRSATQGYAYFLHENLSLSHQAMARLQSMAELHELGSGFDVAARDLEIRGAGSLLGTEQSGMADRVGFDLYMRMLKKSIRQLRALDLPNVPRTNVLLPQGEGAIDASTSFFTIPPSYMPDEVERLKNEGAARIAESSAELVELTKEWKENFGPLPPSLIIQMKTLHLHSCTRALGIDLVGLMDSTDLILRCPGLRPRHWATICSALPKSIPPLGLDTVIPGRFCPSGGDMVIIGGMKLESEVLKLAHGQQQAKLTALELLTEDDGDEWDSFDDEEVGAMKDISSAVNVRAIDEIDIERYPRFIISSFSVDVPAGKRVDALLKIFLPIVNVVHSKHKEDKEKAQAAVQFRERQERMTQAKKEALKKLRLREKQLSITGGIEQ